MGAAGDEVSVPSAPTASMAGLFAQAGKPFVVDHDLAERLGWGCSAGVPEVLAPCPVAKAAVWHSLLSPDGVVGHYDREKWGIDVLPPDEAAVGEARVSSAAGAAGLGCRLRWQSLAGQLPEAVEGSTPPRHWVTGDLSLDEALSIWEGKHEFCQMFGSSSYVYLRGNVSAPDAEKCLQGSIFEALSATASFGSGLPKLTLYASQQGLQTNLHVDEHSGFLVQISGRKRVVLFSRKGGRALRCAAWRRPDAPICRRSWFDDGVPDAPGWADRAPFASLGGCEVDLGPGEALYIPKGYFHDVLSRSRHTLGAVLRCNDC